MNSINKKIALALAAVAACGGAAASESYDLRYAPGVGGADMSAPFEGGWVLQVPAYVYSGNVRSTTSVTTPFSSLGVGLTSGSATTTIKSNQQINVYGLLPRLSYMSGKTFLGATIGGTVLVPLLNKKISTSVTGVSTTTSDSPADAATTAYLQSAVNTAATASATTAAAGNSNSAGGIGDVEISPILRWSTDTSQTLFIMTVVTPTGDYEASRAANPSAGKFWTIRPAVQYSYIGDGWDVAGRAAYSYNTTNTESHYRTGNYVNVDFALMKSLGDSTRLGLAGYAVDQVTRDTRKDTPTDTIIQARQAVTLDEKGHVYGIGPEFAYIHGAGDFLIDGRLMKEFAAEYRPKGFTAFLTLSKPF
jgi:hypothetical protein